MQYTYYSPLEVLMDYMTWTTDLSVGVTQFDDEHKELINIINMLNTAIISDDPKSHLEKILSNLAKYTRIHFSHEEELMEKHGYPDYQAHRQEHDALTSQVTDYISRLTEGKTSFSLDLMSFLRDWLVNHINGSDKKYSAFFKEKGVA